MTLAEIRERYGVPAEVGMRVSWGSTNGFFFNIAQIVDYGPCVNHQVLVQDSDGYLSMFPPQALTYYNDNGDVIWRPE